MHQVITNQRVSGGKVRNVKAFAESIGHSASNFSKFSGKNKRSVTVEMIEAICRRHDVNPAWLILGKGPMFMQDETELQKLIEKLRKALK